MLDFVTSLIMVNGVGAHVSTMELLVFLSLTIYIYMT